MRSESVHLTKIFVCFADFAHARTHAHTHTHTHTYTHTYTYTHTHTYTHARTHMQASKQAGLVSKVISSTIHICQTQFSEVRPYLCYLLVHIAFLHGIFDKKENQSKVNLNMVSSMVSAPYKFFSTHSKPPIPSSIVLIK